MTFGSRVLICLDLFFDDDDDDDDDDNEFCTFSIQLSCFLVFVFSLHLILRRS